MMELLPFCDLTHPCSSLSSSSSSSSWTRSADAPAALSSVPASSLGDPTDSPTVRDLLFFFLNTGLSEDGPASACSCGSMSG